MGIENVNRAKCDKCGKETYSTLKQTAFLETLKQKGWSGNINKLYCSNCTNGRNQNNKQKGRGEYFGSIDSIHNFDGEYYVKIVNPALAVYIPYTEFALLNANSLPSVEYIKTVCKNNEQDPSRVKYHRTNKEKIAGKEMLIAHLCAMMNKEK